MLTPCSRFWELKWRGADSMFWTPVESVRYRAATVEEAAFPGGNSIPRRFLEHGEYGALWIGKHGEAAYALQGRGRHIEFCTQLSGLSGRRVHVGDVKVNEPMRRNILRGRNSANELLAVLDMQIRARIFPFTRRDDPAEPSRIELFGPVAVRRIQVRPTQNAGFVDNADTSVFVGLPHRKHCTGRILKDSHSAGFEDIKSGHQHLGT